MELLNLPHEILFHIIRSIGLEDVGTDIRAITRFAMTGKRSFTVTEAAIGCTLRELCSLEKRFPPPVYYLQWASDVVAERDDLKARFPDIIGASEPPDLSYLNFDGSLSWLRPSGSKANFAPSFPDRKLDAIIAEAKRHHLVLPPAFLTLMRSPILQRRIHSSYNFILEFGPHHIVECPSCMDHNAGGYAIRFSTDYRGDDYTSLYLDPMGQHCVLISQYDSNTEFDDTYHLEGAGLVEEFASDCTPVAMDFEEYLYHVWIDGKFFETAVSKKKKRLSKAQMMYLEQMQQQNAAQRVKE